MDEYQKLRMLCWIGAFSGVIGMQMHPGFQKRAQEGDSSGKKHWYADILSASHYADTAVEEFDERFKSRAHGST